MTLHSYNHFSGTTLVSRYQNVPMLDFAGAKDGGSSGDSGRAKLQSNCHHQHPTQLFTGQMPFLSVTQPTVLEH